MADTYTVTAQRKTVQTDSSGRITAGVEIDFTTKPTGVASSIFVPEGQYNPTDTAQLLETAAANVEAIHSL
jgi:hypothetical protein